jgi:pimeloyl-ACP methyl ester carboxylesterase
MILAAVLAVPLLCCLVIVVAFYQSRYGVPATKTYEGRLASGAIYIIQVPDRWNGELALYSHGYVPPHFPNISEDATDGETRRMLLAQGYALAGSSYSQTGYAVEQALADQAALDALFPMRTGLHPTRTIVWGRSLGGLVTAALVQRYPTRYDGALPLCGVLGGSVFAWNGSLDLEYGFKTLLAPTSSLQLVHIKNGSSNFILAEQIVTRAQGTPSGRARVALVASLLDLPGWYDAFQPRPGPLDYDAQEEAQAQWIQTFSIPFYFGWRQELEARAGGNPSSNVGVDYRARFEHVADRVEVETLYRRAGLDLDADLSTLQDGPRIAADPAAAEYLHENIDLDGQISVPVLTVRSVEDGLVTPAHDAAYFLAVNAAGDGRLLQQRFIDRPGHCEFSPQEVVAAFDALDERIHTGSWGAYDLPAALNASAARMGQPRWAPAFVEYSPRPVAGIPMSRYRAVPGRRPGSNSAPH